MKIKKFLGKDDIKKDMCFLTNYFENNRKSIEEVFLFDPSNKYKYLHEYIDKLNLEDSALFKFKVCYEIKGLKVTYHKDGISTPCSKMSELVQLIDKTIKQDVIIENDNRTDLSNIVQQLIYLSVPLDNVRVMTRREINDADKINRFNQNSNELLQEVNYAYENIQRLELDSNFSKTRDNITKSFEIIQENIKIVQDTTLKVAVAASKKSGKSVIVNSMLEQEIAPTSLELATPNNCIYSLSNDSKYHLNDKSFETKKDIYDAIEKEFKEAQMNSRENFTLPEMDIRYVPNNDNFAKYKIYDTPGPDLAGAIGHTNAAKKAMQEVDVVIFAIDYTKYLTDSEEKYLKEVKEIFNNNGKFYSLIFTVNKIDQCYTSKDGNKSIIRILDFIRSKIIAIDEKFKDCIIMGTSSLIYFNCIEAMDIPCCREFLLENNDIKGATFENCMDSIDDNKNFNNKEISNYNTILKFLGDQVGNMRRFNKIKNISIDTIKEFSGMPSLLNYVYYVAENKARDEKINSCMSKIDIEYTKIKNTLNIDELKKSILENLGRLEVIKSILNDFSEEVQNVFTLENNLKVVESLQDTNIQYYGSLKDFLKKNPELSKGDNFYKFHKFIEKGIFNQIDESFDQIQITEEIVNNQFKTELRRSIDKAFNDYNKFYEEDGDIKNKSGKVISKDQLMKCINHEINNISKLIANNIQDTLNRNTSDSNKYLEDYKNFLETILEYIIHSQMKGIIKKYQEKLKKDNIDFNIAVPSFKVSFEAVSISKIALKINIPSLNKMFENFISDSEKDRIFRGGIGFMDLIDKIFGNTKNVILFDFNKFYGQEMKNILELAILKTNFQLQYKSDIDKFEKNISNYLDKIESQRKYYIGSVNETLENIGIIFNEDSIELEKKVQYANSKKTFFENVKLLSKGYFCIWEGIIRNDVEYSNNNDEVHI